MTSQHPVGGGVSTTAKLVVGARWFGILGFPLSTNLSLIARGGFWFQIWTYQSCWQNNLQQSSSQKAWYLKWHHFRANSQYWFWEGCCKFAQLNFLQNLWIFLSLKFISSDVGFPKQQPSYTSLFTLSGHLNHLPDTQGISAPRPSVQSSLGRGSRGRIEEIYDHDQGPPTYCWWTKSCTIWDG